MSVRKTCEILARKAVVWLAILTPLPGVGAGTALADCPPRYEITAIVDGPDCPYGQTAYVNPAGLNDDGQFVGSFSCPVGEDQPMLWDDGAFIALELPDGYSQGLCEDINSQGVISGWINYPHTPFVWHDSELIALPIPPEASGAGANAISDTGLVVGVSDFPLTPLLWESGEVVPLDVPIGPNALAADISADGTRIVGWMGESPGFESRVFVWEDGEVTDLGTLFGGEDAWAEAVNDCGSVVGTAATPISGKTEFKYHAFLWRDGEAIDLGTVAGFDRSYARDVNDSDIVVGQCRISTKGFVGHAFVWRDGVMWDLNDLVPEVPDLTFKEAVGANGSGQILVQGKIGTHSVAVLLTPEEALIGDLDCDGEVGIIDLLALLGQWGPCSPPPDECPADLFEDGTVDVVDLLLLLADWGVSTAVDTPNR